VTSRRDLLVYAACAALAPLLSEFASAADSGRNVVKPPRLRRGDTVGLIVPASANWDPMEIDILLEALSVLGLKGRLGAHVDDRRGYFAGRDEDRAADLNSMLRDPGINAIHCIRGGWGAARLLPLLDFEAAARQPKALIGYSDITALLLALHARTGIVTFHGPNGSGEWNRTNVDWMQRVLWRGEMATFVNPRETEETIVPEAHRTRTLYPGKARGRLIGGNLTVLTALVGTPYLPDFTDAVLFLEDVEEAPYRVDRMLVQLKQAGVLGRLRGVVWGTCTRCTPGEGFGSLTIPDVLNDHIASLRVPAYYGAMIGHLKEQFTLPIGVMVELDADAGTLRMLESAVS